MNARIYKSKAAKQAEYRQAVASGFDSAHGGVRAYRAALAAGKVTPPPYVPNRGWYGQPHSKHDTFRYPKTHIASAKPESTEYLTACGKFLEDVKLVTDIGDVTCAKCRTTHAHQKVTPPVTHTFNGKSVMTPLCLMKAGKRAKRGKEYAQAKGCPPTCKACLAAIDASVYVYDGPTDEIGDPVCTCPPDSYLQDCPHCSMPSKVTQPKRDGRKTHMLNIEGSKITRCTKDVSKVLIAPDGTAPTCKVCLIGTSYPDADIRSKVTDGLAYDAQLEAQRIAALPPDWRERRERRSASIKKICPSTAAGPKDNAASPCQMLGSQDYPQSI